MNRSKLSLSLLSLLFFLHFSLFSIGNKAPEKLKFKADNTFRIAQFTDIHWDSNNPEVCDRTIELLQSVITAEKPDFVVLTGDIVTVSPAKDGWLRIAKVFEQKGLPWSVVLGNHDDETDLSRSQIFELLVGLPGFMGEKGPVSGIGNYVLQVQGNQVDQTSALLYFLDSHAYTQIPGAGTYDWFRFDQIDWYRKQSQSFSEKNAGNPYPALAFFHIPTPEYKEVMDKPFAMGVKNEDVACGVLNPGMITAFIEMGDVMGTFVGHDHVNNYIGVYHGIALAYGQKTGFNSYGDLPKGARIIELHQNERSFNTWVRTSEGEAFHYNYPFGQTFLEKDITYQPALQLDKVSNGVKFAYYEGKIQSVNDFTKMTPARTGIVQKIEIPAEASLDHFGYVFEGLIEIKQKGLYRFYLESDDGSVLWIDEQELINNDGSHSAERKKAVVALEAGFHSFKLAYFDDYWEQKLEIGLLGRGLPEQQLPETMIFHRVNIK